MPLGDVADVAIVPAPNEIKREGASRRIDVTCNVTGRDLGSVAREIERRAGAVSFEQDTTPSSSASSPRGRKSQTRLLALRRSAASASS